MAEPIPDAVVIAAIELVLKTLGSASIHHYMPDPKADAIEAMRGLLTAERERAAAVVTTEAAKYDDLAIGTLSVAEKIRLDQASSFLHSIADAIRKGAA
jgi:hypothetical protein